MGVTAWELVFMMVVLKLPILYLIGVVWWAVRAQPEPFEPASLVPVAPTPEPPRSPAPARCQWHDRRRSTATRSRRRPITVGAR